MGHSTEIEAGHRRLGYLPDISCFILPTEWVD